MLALPFAPLVAADSASLGTWPGSPVGLRSRMSAVFGVDADAVLPTRGATHAIELVLRQAARRGPAVVAARPSNYIDALAKLHGLRRIWPATAEAAVVLVASPGMDGTPALTPAAAAEMAGRIAPALLVVDESLIEFDDADSLAPLAVQSSNMLVTRSLSFAHAIPGARCGALIASAALIAQFEALLEPHSLSGPTIAAAEAALSPSRTLAATARWEAVKAERGRLAEALGRRAEVLATTPAGPFLLVTPRDAVASAAALRRLGVEVARDEGPEGPLRVAIGSPASNDLLLAAFGATGAGSPARRGTRVRDTRETRIVAVVDLDNPGQARISTGLGFYDHMLEQLAVHGGFGLELACEGDLHVDAHHVIEDSALALGAAISDALGERRGIGRYGFTTPMDEALARVSLDLSGRPFCRFRGEFRAARLGDYPTQMTAHVFRSLAEGMRAAIHVEVDGEDDHHKTEACFKAMGRALRQAKRREDSAMPSSKGVL